MRDIIIWIPWVLGALGMFGFAGVASRSGGSPIGWGAVGGLCCVLESGILLGLANAVTLPYSSEQWDRLQRLATVVSVALILVALGFAWFLSPYRAKRSA